MKTKKFLAFFLSINIIFCTCILPVWATETTTATETTQDSTEESTTQVTVSSELLNPLSSVLTSDSVTNSIKVSISGTAALLVDVESRTILYAKNEDEKVYPASITKIMTALIVLEAIEAGEISMDTIVTLTDEANADITSDSSTAGLVTGEEISVENLMYCMLVYSANEAANALAVAVAGSVNNFVTLMNYRAEQLGCTGTHFVNPHGLHSENHYTTCADLYLITEAAWQYEDFQIIVGTDEYYVPETNMHAERHLYNTNLLISEKKTSGYMYTYAIGIKTGTTLAAGACLVAAAVYEDRLLFAIEMGTSNYTDSSGNVIRPVYTEIAQLFRHGFVDFYPLQVVEKDELVTQVAVEMGKDTDYVLVTPVDDVTISLVKGLTSSDFDRVFNLPDSIQAPVSAGDVVGTLDLLYDGEVYASVDLVAVSDVELSVSAQAEATVQGFFENPIVRLLLVILCILVVLLVILLASSLTRRSRERNRARRRAERNRRRQAGGRR